MLFTNSIVYANSENHIQTYILIKSESCTKMKDYFV
jgi:hypothetical protein